EPQFKLETALKDAQLVRELAARSGVELSVIEATAARFAQAAEAGHGDEDMAATWYATAPL
ncbi:MAG TPA: NAD-binding protein, partial [Gaiellaceae bacterium]